AVVVLRATTLLVSSQRHLATLPDPCCCCSRRHPLLRIPPSTCDSRGDSRVLLLDPEKVGLPSLNPLRHSCRGPRLRNSLQSYGRSTSSLAATGRPIRLSSLSRAG